MKLTVDSNGKLAGKPGFDPKKIVQFGYIPQWGTSLQALGTQFGANIMVDAQGNAKIPPNWLASWKFFYKAIWKDHYMANNDILNTPEFGQGNPFNSGKFAMGYTHLWYTCCLDARHRQSQELDGRRGSKLPRQVHRQTARRYLPHHQDLEGQG